MIMSLTCMMAVAAQVFAQKATVYTTIESNPWVKTNVKMMEKTHHPTADVIVYSDSILQPIEGFGGTFSERGRDAMQVLSPTQRLSLIQEFFGVDGIHFAWGRTPVGGNDFSIFIAQYLGPQLEQDSVKTDLWLGTVNYPNPQWVFRFFENDKVMKYIKGVGMQWTGMQAMPKVHEVMPTMPLMQTEGICGDGDNDWKDMEYSWERIVHCFRSGARSYMQWNMVLGDDLESLFEWRQNTLVIIDRKTGQVERTPEYWLMKHFSHFVQPGSVLLKTSEMDHYVAFRNSEGKVVVVCYNPDKKEKELIVQNCENIMQICLKGKSLNTIVF